MTSTRNTNTNTIDRAQLREGMGVFSGEGLHLGRIERLDANSLTADGQRYEFILIDRIEGDRVFLTRQVGATTDPPRPGRRRDRGHGPGAGGGGGGPGAGAGARGAS